MNKKKRCISAAIVALTVFCMAAGIAQLPDTRTVSPAVSRPSSETPDYTALQETDPSLISQADHLTGFRGVDSYETIYQALTDLYEQKNRYSENDTGDSGFLRDLFSFDMAKEAAPEDSAATGVYESGAVQGNTSRTDEYSRTNLQEQGVDEADVIKTDGTWIYILKSGGQIQIMTADGADSRIISTINPPEWEENALDMYVDGDTLNLITTGCETKMEEMDLTAGQTKKEDILADDLYTVDSRYYTKLYTYDISDREHPSLSGSIMQEGYYTTSRKNGDTVYLFTSYHPDLQRMDTPESYIPTVNDSLLRESDICLPEQISNSDYLVMSSVNIKDPSKTVDTKAIVSGAQNFYISTENIYITNTAWQQETRTELLKFHYSDGRITGADATSLKGYINDSFSLNEYKGYLRIVVTENTTNADTNSLYVLDGSLNICGSIRDIARGETIQSARFMGDTGYFVTYRNMDPLFSVDLSDPNAPKILGELKITGFSSYLHFYGKDQLLGIGYETDPDTGETYGIKLSMFNIADPSNVTESRKYVIKDAWDCSVLSDYKAVMLDDKKNVIGFTCDGQYLIFSYDNTGGFKNVFAKELTTGNGPAYYRSMDRIVSGYARGCYVKDAFYLISHDSVLIYDMEQEFNAIGKVDLL